MLRLYHRPADPSLPMEPRPLEDLDSLLEGEGWVWLDVEAEGPATILELDARFHLGKLVLEDLLEPTAFPKVMDSDSSLLLVMHALAPDTTRFRTIEVNHYLTDRLLITAHGEAVPSVDYIRTEACQDATLAEGGPDRMVARIAEAGTRRYLPLLDGLDDKIAELEELAVIGDRSVPAEIQGLRRDAVLLRRIISPQRQVFHELSREGHPLISERARRRFADVYDQHHRIVEGLDSARSVLAGALDTYRSTVAENMNEVMKVLTVFSAILLPLSLMAGIYGMNFVNIPELELRWGYFALLGVMAVTATTLWVWFARKGFVGGPRWRRVPAVVGKGLADLVHITVSPIRVLGSLAGQVLDTTGGEDREDVP